MKVGIQIPLVKEVYDRIAHAVEQGFDNAQLVTFPAPGPDSPLVDEVKRACKDFNFTITAVWCGWSGPIVWGYPHCYTTLGLVPPEWRAQRTQELIRGAAFARAIGVQDIITHIGYLPDNPFHPDNMGVVNSLRMITEELKKYDQYFLFETGEELPLSLVHLMNAVGADNLGINFDPANLIMNGRGSCPAVALKFLGPYIRGFHVKDALQLVAPECQKIEVPAGKGDVDYPRIVEVLREIGYDGYLTIEYEKSSDPNLEQTIAEIKAYIESLIA